VSKHGYHKGTVLIACPSCRARHVISDHLKIFGDKAMTVEDLLRERGEAVKRGILQPIEENAEEVVEVWDDGTVTEREPFPEPAPRVPKEEDNLPPGATFKTVRAGEAKKEE
jgi:protein import protein ZIM17